MFELSPCNKGYTQDLDKALAPEQTIDNIRSVLDRTGHSILDQAQRVDTGRLGIPVYMSVCGPKAREIMPTRKQMGKGASAAQAEASALMELIERYSLFAFLGRTEEQSQLSGLTWSQAKDLLGSELISLTQIISSVHEELPWEEAARIMDLLPWSFCPARDMRSGRRVYLPLDWFRTINEFNGSSAGNTAVESALQGLCELVERHVCARIESRQPELPTIDPGSLQDPTLLKLYKKFTRQGIRVWLKDFSLDFQVPTVGALAYDPATFPSASEIVFTAGTATSPAKAAIRALTEVAQLAGDFESQSCYEPSGLSKCTSLDACRWVQQGPVLPLASLPDISHPDMARELSRLVQGIHDHGYTAYVVDTTHPELNVPAHYCVVPGFDFRERSPQASLGLFIGRMLAEQRPFLEAQHGLHVLESVYPNAHFLPFFHGLLALRQGSLEKAREAFAQAEPIQPTAQDQAFAAFYQAYCLSQEEAWEDMKPILTRAVDLAPDIHAVFNLRGVAYFKSGEYEQAVKDFRAALSLDPGSATDLANLGICMKRLGRIREAISCLQAGVELDPGLERAQSELEDLLARE